MASCKTILTSSYASQDSSPCSIQIDSKPNETHKSLDLAQVMFKPIFKIAKLYVECQYKNFITCNVSCLQALTNKGFTRTL